MRKSKEDLTEMPKQLQNFVKTIYLVGFSIILAIIFTLIEYVLFGSNNPDRMFGYYMIAQTIICFGFINENIRISKIYW